MKRLRILFAALTLAGFCLVAEPAVAGSFFVGLRFGPPSPRHEVMMVRHRHGSVWVRGHWTWLPRWHRYIWVGGRWIPARRGYVWADGCWNRTPGGRVCRDEYWAR